MKIAIIGAGAVGTLVAARLAKAKRNVTVICREHQLEKIQKDGLRLLGSSADISIKIPVFSRLQAEYDLVIFTTQTQDLEDAYQQNSDYLENCHVLTLQNGVQAENILSSHFDRDKIVSGLINFDITHVNPGEVSLNADGDIFISNAFIGLNPFVHEVADELRSAFNVTAVESVVAMKWMKLLSQLQDGVPVLLGKSNNDAFSDDGMLFLGWMILKEGFDIVKKGGAKLISLPDFSLDDLNAICSMPKDEALKKLKSVLLKEEIRFYKNSMLQTIKRGKKSEVDFINGEIATLASGVKDKAPLNNLMLQLVHKVEMTGEFFTQEKIKEVFKLDKLFV